MEPKINFTKEHLKQLQGLMSDMLFSGETVSGIAGTKLNAHQLLHETSIKTLQQLLQQTNKDIESQTKLDRWSMTAYQQEKLSTLKWIAEILDLLIGYKKFLADQEDIKEKLKAKRELLENLKDQDKKPADRIKEVEQEIAALEAQV